MLRVHLLRGDGDTVDVVLPVGLVGGEGRGNNGGVDAFEVEDGELSPYATPSPGEESRLDGFLDGKLEEDADEEVVGEGAQAIPAASGYRSGGGGGDGRGGERGSLFWWIALAFHGNSGFGDFLVLESGLR